MPAALEEGWHFLKFRYLRWMAARDNLEIKLWMSFWMATCPCGNRLPRYRCFEA
jgi:hypothetical protein